MFSISKKVLLIFLGIMLALCLLTIIDALHQERRAEVAIFKYEKWANSSAGITARRLQRDIDRQNRTDILNCYADKSGPDYNASLDCPQALAPRVEVTPPTPWLYRSLWYYSWPSRLIGDDLSESINKWHIEAVEYWENKDSN